MFETMTPETIKAQVFAGLLESGVEVDTREGSYTDALIGPAALEIWKLYQSLNELIPIVYPDETSGEYIDRRCAYYGIERKQGTRAQVQLQMVGQAGAVVPKGSIFLTAEGLRFLTDEEGVLVGEGLEVMATAAEVGTHYNVRAGEVLRQLVSLAGVSGVVNQKAAFGGFDPETDKALLARLYTRLREAATSGNVSHYQQWALEVAGVGAVKVIPLEQGPGTVGVLLASAEMGVVDETVVMACKAHLEACRPIGATVTVRAAEGLEIRVGATVAIDPSTTVQAVQAAFQKALAAYLKSISFVQYEIPYTKVGYLLAGVNGVLDYHKLTINGKAENLLIGSSQVPQLGEVRIDAIA